MNDSIEQSLFEAPSSPKPGLHLWRDDGDILGLKLLQVDLYGSVEILEGLRVFAEVNNLNDEPFRAYFGGSNRLSQFEEYGVSGAIGAKWSF